MKSQTSFRMAFLDVKLAISVREIIFERAKLYESVYRSSLDGVMVTFVVALPGVEGVVVFCGALVGLDSSANRSLEDVVYLWRLSASSLELDVIKTNRNDSPMR